MKGGPARRPGGRDLRPEEPKRFDIGFLGSATGFGSSQEESVRVRPSLAYGSIEGGKQSIEVF